ncbi:MAG: DUF3604 domain-containing protein [Planctomycetota bacterium]
MKSMRRRAVFAPLSFAALLTLGLGTVEEYFSYDPPALKAEPRRLGTEQAYDAGVLVDEAGAFAAWLEYEPGEGDRLAFAALAEVDEPAFVGEAGRYASPRLTRDAAGALWLTYELRGDDDAWNIAARRRGEDGAFAEPTLLGEPGVNNIHHDAAASPSGQVWVAWQTDRNGQWDVVSRIVPASPEARTKAVQVSDSPYGDWHPSIDVDAGGVAHIVWDSFDGHSFNVVGRRHELDYWAPVYELAATPAFEGRAKIACGPDRRVYVLWEEGGENWGGEYRSVIELWNNVTDARGPVHRLRRLRLGEWRADGALIPTAEPLPMPSLDRAAAEERRPGVRDLGVFYERGELAVDGAGRPWVAYRHYVNLQLGRAEPVKHHIERGWTVYARCLTASGWTPLAAFDEPQRDGMQRLSLAAGADGAHLVWTTGRTDRRKDERARGLALGEATARGAAPAPTEAGADRVRAVEATAVRNPPPPEPAPAEVAGDSYRLFFGDLHRHTDLSLCFPFFDGSIDDAYRYATEVAGLDFLGITDHTRDIDRGDVQSQLWWRCTKEVERHELRRTFFPMFAYERSHGHTDHNVISLRSDMLENFPPPLPEFWSRIEDRDTFTIPHNPFLKRVWDEQDDDRRPLLEIYQGCRDQDSVKHAHTGLAKGYRLGFIASSDHMSTSASFACVWAPEADREAIFRALQARRTYGATARMRLLVRAGERWMGEAYKARRTQPLTVEIEGTAPLEAVELVVDGEVVQTVAGEALSGNAWQGQLGGGREVAEETWAYVHVLQADGNRAWSSPIWTLPAE